MGFTLTARDVCMAVAVAVGAHFMVATGVSAASVSAGTVTTRTVTAIAGIGSLVIPDAAVVTSEDGQATAAGSASVTSVQGVQAPVQTLSAEQAAWFATAVGRYIDPDGAYGYQCVDVADDYCTALWGDWYDTLGAVGYAYELFDRANSAYFTKFAYDPSNPNLIPQAGDIVIWGSNKPDSNGAGHVAVVVNADATGMQVMEQNHDANGEATLPCVQQAESYAYVIGWLRPNVS